MAEPSNLNLGYPNTNQDTYNQQRNAVLASMLKAMQALSTAIDAQTTAIENTFPRTTGTLTLAAAATTVVSELAVTASSRVFLFPNNSSAGTLVGSSKSPYISARSAGVSFTVATADATAAAGGEVFQYVLIG